MVFSQGGGGDSSQVGAASFGIGIDLEQFRKDLDAAERLAKQRADRIQKALGSIPLSGGGGAGGGGGSSSSNSVPPPPPGPSPHASGTGLGGPGFPLGSSGGGGGGGSPAAGAAPDDAKLARERARWGPQPLSSAQWSRHLQREQRTADRDQARLDRETQQEQARADRAAQGAQRDAERAQARIDQLKQQDHARAQSTWQRRLAGWQRQRERHFDTVDARTALAGPAAAAFFGDPNIDPGVLTAGRRLLGQAGFADRLQAQQRAQMGPFPMRSDIVTSYRRNLGLNSQGNPLPPRRGGGGGGDDDDGGLSPTTLTRIGAALVGIPLGFSIAAGAAALLHGWIVASVTAASNLERAGRSVGAAFGPASQRITGPGASAFEANPLTRGTRTDFLQTAASLGPLAAQYGLTADQVSRLVTVSGQLARIHNVDLKQAGATLQEVLRGNLEAGQALDLQLTNEYGLIRGTGASWETLVQSQGLAAAKQRVVSLIFQDSERIFANSAQNTNANVQSLDRLGKAWDTLQTRFSMAAAGPVGVAAGVAANVVEGASGGAPPQAALLPLVGVLIPAIVASVTAYILNKGIGDYRAGKPDVTGLDPNRQPTVPSSGIAAPRVGAGARATITGPIPEWPGGLPAGFEQEELAGQLLARQVPLPVGFQNEQLIGQLYARQVPLPNLGPRPSRDDLGAAALTKQSQANLQIQLAQSQLDQLSGAADLRRLQVAGSVVDLQRERLELQGQVAPMLLQEQSLQSQIRVITRENLGLTENRLRAEQSALQPTQTLAALNFEQRRALLRAQVSIVDQMQGRAPEFDIGAQISTVIATAFARPRAELGSLEAGRGVEVAGFAQQADQLAKAIAALGPQRALQALQLGEGGILSLQLAQAANEASAAAIERSLQLTTLMFSPQVVAAEQALAEARVKAAEAAQAIITLGTTGQGGPSSLPPITVDLSNLTVGPDVQSLVNLVVGAAQQGVYEGLARGAGLNAPRLDSNTAGGRGP